MTEGVLVIGYGNALRSDDGFGWHAAARLADDPRLLGATVLQRHQLTPELALDISQASLVVLVDARFGPSAGTIAVERLASNAGQAAPMTHHLDPAGLVDLANELYGRAPDVFLLSVGVRSVEAGDRLTPAVEAALPRVVEAVIELLASHAPRDRPVTPAGHSRA